MATIKCNEISKSYGAVTALKGVTMEVDSGEVRALFGGNGSGKSTMAKIIGGFVRPSKGELIFNGSAVSFDSPAKAKKSRVIITAQELSLFPNLTLVENLTICNMPTKTGCVNRKSMRKMAEEALKQVKLSELIDQTVDSLSLNQKYMVEFAKALVQKPEVLILDEITSALYREEVAIVESVVKSLKASGCSVIFVSHRMPEIYAMCDTITILRNGDLVGTYEVAKKTKNELLSLMTGRNITDVEVAEPLQETNDKTELLSVKQLRTLSDRTAVDLVVYEGEVVGVAGLQGNGQSELVRALFAMDNPVSINLEGVPTIIKNPGMAVRKGIAFISGERELEGTFSNRSILENVSAITDLVLNRRKNTTEQLDLLKKYNVVMNNASQQIQTLSGGNQQKVVMARWTAIEPKVILADDPTKGIDVNARRDVHQLIRELTQRGSVVIFVSGDDEELVELTRSVSFSRVLVMCDGMIAKTLHGSDITTENIATYAMPKGNEVKEVQ